jgi:hypothetical protein
MTLGPAIATTSMTPRHRYRHRCDVRDHHSRRCYGSRDHRYDPATTALAVVMSPPLSTTGAIGTAAIDTPAALAHSTGALGTAAAMAVTLATAAIGAAPIAATAPTLLAQPPLLWAPSSPRSPLAADALPRESRRTSSPAWLEGRLICVIADH